MTVERGQPWGSRRPLPEHAVTVRTDAEARAVVTEARRAGAPVPALGLLGGDLCRTLGGPRPDGVLPPDDALVVPVDLGSVLLDGRQHWFVAHLVARRSWWRGRVVVAMNAQYLGRWDVAPSGHPNDGRLDVLDASLAGADRLKAWRRLPSGTHVPHPGIRQQRVRAWSDDLVPPLRVWLDGVPMGEVRRLALRLEPDALLVAV